MHSVDTGDKVDGVTAHNGLTMDALVASHGIVYVLPTEDEWYKAAYFSGSGYSLYPDASGAPPPMRFTIKRHPRLLDI